MVTWSYIFPGGEWVGCLCKWIRCLCAYAQWGGDLAWWIEHGFGMQAIRRVQILGEYSLYTFGLYPHHCEHLCVNGYVLYKKSTHFYFFFFFMCIKGFSCVMISNLLTFFPCTFTLIFFSFAYATYFVLINAVTLWQDCDLRRFCALETPMCVPMLM
jgi:hypothetical protein